MGQLIQTGQRDIPYHTKSCPVYKHRGVARRGQSETTQWVVSNCIVQCLSILGFCFLSLLFVKIIILLLILPLVLLCFNSFHFINCSNLSPNGFTLCFFPDSSSLPIRGKEVVSKWLCGTEVAIWDLTTTDDGNNPLSPGESVFHLPH